LRLVGYFVVSFGAILMLASLFADQIALGMPGSGFGWKQFTGTIVGLMILGAGGYMLYRTRSDDSDVEDVEGGDRIE
jgi:hypothetical protein